jgi:hypothetical protein
VVSWCSADEVSARVNGNPPAELLQEFADRATSLLYTLSGRRFQGRKMVTIEAQVGPRGYVKLTPWVPVRSVISSDYPTVGLTPAGTAAIVAPDMAGAIIPLTIEYGEDPPASGRDAAAALAAHMLRSDSRYAELVKGTPAQEDVLPPAHITSIARQGVTYSYADRAALAREDQTGVYEVDLFLRAVNPTGMRHQPKVVAP